MQINGLNTTLIKAPKSAGDLGLRDGQQITGKIIYAASGEAILKLVNQTIQVKMSGKPLAAGTLALFRVCCNASGTVELQVLDRLTQEQLPLSEQPQFPQLKTLILTSLQTTSRAITPENYAAAAREIVDFAESYPQLPFDLVGSFLTKHAMPFTAVTALYAWLHQDQQLRSQLWNWIVNSQSTKQNSAFWRKLIDLADEPLTPKLPPIELKKQAVTENGQWFERESEESELERVESLLEKSLNFENALTAKNSGEMDLIVPLLVRTAAGLITEYQLHWRENAPESGETAKRETRIRLVIPTVHLGEIRLTMLVDGNRIRIGFKVGSGLVKEYLAQHLAELQKNLGGGVQISIALSKATLNPAGRINLWI